MLTVNTPFLKYAVYYNPYHKKHPDNIFYVGQCSVYRVVYQMYIVYVTATGPYVTRDVYCRSVTYVSRARVSLERCTYTQIRSAFSKRQINTPFQQD